jgi:hypothetical protein
MDYLKFRKDFEKSGLTQKAYGERISMSGSMVQYYLRKSRSFPISNVGFTEVSVSPKTSDRQIKIITPDGLEIYIPV